MPTLQMLNEKRTERKKLCDAAGEILSLAHKENRAMKPEEQQRWAAMHGEAAKIKSDFIDPWDQQLKLELDFNEAEERTAGLEDTQGGETRAAGAAKNEEDRKAQQAEFAARERRMFRGWMRYGDEGLTDEERKIVNTRRQIRQKAMTDLLNSQAQYMSQDQLDFEKRALAAGTSTAGGYTVPQDFEYKLDVALKAYGGMFQTSEIIPTSDGRLLPYPSVNDTQNTGESTAENAAVGGSGISGANAEVDPTFGVTNFNAYMKDSGIVLIPVQLIEDGAFDIEKMLIDLLKIRIGRFINSLATTSGSGSSDITALLSAATQGVAGTSASTITYNNLIALFHSVDPLYREANSDNGTQWMFADTTLQAIAQLVDSNSRPLFIAGGVSEGIQNAPPDTIHGYPYTINQQMPAIGSAAKCIVFGALKKYKLRKVREVQLVRFGERYMTNLQIGFLGFIRVDGNLVDAGTHPVKYFQNSVT